MVAAAQQSSPQLRYNVYYQCNGERIAVGHCRKDSDIPGAIPTTEQQNYCMVYYPDRPRRNGILVQATELRSDMIRKLQACGALAGGTDNRVEAYLADGAKYYDAKDYAKALDAYKAAAALKPDAKNSTAAYNGIGLSYFRLNQLDEAVSAFRQVLTFEPDNPAILRTLGSIYFTLKKYPDAEAVLLHALRVKPDQTLDNYFLGWINNDREQYAKAVPYFREELRLNPNYGLCANELGYAYFMLNQYSDAVVTLQRAIQLAPHDATPEYTLGRTYLHMGNKNAALQVHKKLLTMDKQKADDLDEEMDYMSSEEAPANAVQKPAQPGNVPNPNTPQARQYILLGSLLEVQHKYDEALTNYQKAIALKPDTDTLALAYQHMGSLYRDQKQDDNAAHWYSESLRLNPKDTHTSYLLGQTYVDMGRKNDALAIYQNIQTTDKSEAGWLYESIQKMK